MSRNDNRPEGMLRLDLVLAILTGLSMTDADQRTLAIVAEALGVGEFYRPRPTQPATVLLIEQARALLRDGE